LLRLHETDDRAVDIEPVGGRLVCFLTPGRVHEVLPARRERLSISGWFRGREL
jgi:SM-20-related protein